MIARLIALLQPLVSRAAPAVLSLVALVCLVLAAFWQFGGPAGLVAVAAACFLAEWRMVEPKPARLDSRR
ncbi:hypothetical protein ABZ215_13585 [Amycolatopsis sp. NPDC006131]|uniref:hypothetical protein n=1 Tax=Amycolatopsis sp. NPDC006131 TaxID=3156731 RepID=UPI0033AF694B